MPRLNRFYQFPLVEMCNLWQGARKKWKLRNGRMKSIFDWCVCCDFIFISFGGISLSFSVSLSQKHKHTHARCYWWMLIGNRALPSARGSEKLSTFATILQIVYQIRKGGIFFYLFIRIRTQSARLDVNKKNRKKMMSFEFEFKWVNDTHTHAHSSFT